MTFADGHAEMHKWMDPRSGGTGPLQLGGGGIAGLPVKYPNSQLANVPDTLPLKDIYWMWEHAVSK